MSHKSWVILKYSYLADRHGDNFYYANTGSSYANTSNFVSHVYLKKGEKAYYKTEYHANQHTLNGWMDCQTIEGDTHSCTWLEIRKSGEMTVKQPEY